MVFSEKRAEVILSQVIREPYNLAIATARTCYSSQGIITVSDVVKDENARQLRDRIAKSTMEAGHLTTRQHAHFVFSLSNVSRSFIWSFLHSHPYYNSEQVSQRYVEVKPDNYYVPESLSPELKSIYLKSVESIYKELGESFNKHATITNLARHLPKNQRSLAKDVIKAFIKVGYLRKHRTDTFCWTTQGLQYAKSILRI